jgi:mono/diheme cytochrome c family protein
VPPPPAEGPVTEAGLRLGFDEASIVRGREVLASRCGSCHSQIMPAQRSAARWEEVLPTMDHKSRLSASEAADVRAYILAAHEATAAPPRPR